uniref:GDSL esterase/lipase n=1 Tax=Lotus japonicus TaxID=34305 RepID=I3SGX0_LOTJA|nr:unknown [Lotus japonicus]
MGNSFHSLFLCFFIFFFSFGFSSSEAQKKAPAVYVFGDSLFDVGNNNYLSLSLAKAILPYYGIDFPTKKPTGRFSNGKNAADLIAEKVGLPISPAYLSLVLKANHHKNVSYLEGVNFASGGAGIFDGTDDTSKQSIPLTKQVDFYSKVHEQLTQQIGASTLQKRLSKSIFLVVIGSNDIFGYFGSNVTQNKSTPQQFADSMASSLKVHLQRLYNNGARKFEIVGVAALGCCPAYRAKNKKTECFSEANLLAAKYDEVLQSMLKEWQSEKKDLSYSYFDTYAALQDLIQSPSSYGFANVKGACCGLGELNAQIPCLPISNICSNRKDHVFWDAVHPSEAAIRIVVDRLFSGHPKYTSPINMEQLLAI